MTILSDKQIIDLDSALRRRQRADPFPMIEPFEECQVKSRSGVACVSYGLSSNGYDARLAGEFVRPDGGVMDPKKPDAANWVHVERPIGSAVHIPPHGFVLARTVEYFRIPDDVFVICLGKSTYARNGLIVNVTPLEPGWEGHVTLELSNTTSLPSVVYVGEGICQFVFFRGERPAVSYGDRNGKYMKQTGVTLARV
jgi:dCTP deaminase